MNKFTIKELYKIAVKGGFENRELLFSFKDPETGEHCNTNMVINFDKGWTKDCAIINLSIKIDSSSSSLPTILDFKNFE